MESKEALLNASITEAAVMQSLAGRLNGPVMAAPQEHVLREAFGFRIG